MDQIHHPPLLEELDQKYLDNLQDHQQHSERDLDNYEDNELNTPVDIDRLFDKNQQSNSALRGA